MSPHSDILSWFRANQSLLFLLNAASGEATNTNFGFPDMGSNPRSTTKGTLTITTPMCLIVYFTIEIQLSYYINFRKNRRDSQEWTIQGNRQHKNTRHLDENKQNTHNICWTPPYVNNHKQRNKEISSPKTTVLYIKDFYWYQIWIKNWKTNY